MSQLAGRPVIVLEEDAERSKGKDARRSNMMAAQGVAEVLRTALGPRGMDKMLVDSLGDITITCDGATILEEIDVQHPAAQMMVEVSETQDDEVGDGTTTAVLLAGQLLRGAEDLLDEELHPTIIIGGYQKAAEKVLEILEERALDVEMDDEETLMDLSNTAIRSKAVASARDHLSRLAIKAVKQVTERRGDQIAADVDNIQIFKKEGKGLEETKLIKGLIIDKEVVHTDMPKEIRDAEVALIDTPLEMEKTERDAEIRIKSPDSIRSFLDQEQDMLTERVDKIKSTGADVVLCQKGIDDVAQHHLAEAGILAARRVKKSDMTKLARATGASMVSNLNDLEASDLGCCGFVEERKIGGEELIFVEECSNPRALAILVRAGLERMLDEAERSLNDALHIISDTAETPKMVPGGGAIEMELAKEVRSYARRVGGREQLAIEAFADALEIVPRTLAQNAGLDILDTTVALKTAHEKTEGTAIGVNIKGEGVTDMLENGVVEPIAVKTQVIKSAVEAASMILRIDEVVAAAETEAPQGEPGAGAPGTPGGMPPR